MALWYLTLPSTEPEGLNPTDIEFAYPGKWDRRWRDFTWKVPRQYNLWQNSDESWEMARFPTQDQVNNSLWFYRGRAVVDDDNKAAILAAAVGIQESDFELAPEGTATKTPPPNNGVGPMPTPYNA